MHTRIFLFPFLLVWVLIIVTACREQPHTLPTGPIGVSTIIVQPKSIPVSFDYVGVTQSSHLVEIRPRVEGYLDKISYIEGSFVTAGSVMYQLDPKPFEAALDVAKGELSRQEAILANNVTTRERLEPLYKKNAASKKDLDNAISQEKASEAAVLSAKAKVTQAEINLGYTTITAPVSGLTGQSKFREGAFLPGAGSLLTTISVVDPIWVNFSVSENDLLKSYKKIAQHKLVFPTRKVFEVELLLSNGDKFAHKGKLDFADPTIDQKTGTITVRAVFPNPAALLKPGQFVRADVQGAVIPNAILIPQQAVMQGQKGMFVYVKDKDSKAEQRPIEAGDWYHADWIIESGLNPGDEVVVSGVNKIHPGMALTTESK